MSTIGRSRPFIVRQQPTLSRHSSIDSYRVKVVAQLTGIIVVRTVDVQVELDSA